MHPPPAGYKPLADGQVLAEGDLMLGELRASCGQVSYGWRRIPKHWVGEAYYSYDPSHPKCVVRGQDPVDPP